MRIKVALLAGIFVGFGMLTGAVQEPATSYAAFTCPDGTVIEQDPPSDLPEEDQQAIRDDACAEAASQGATPGCTENTFFGIPTWYKYLEKETRVDEATNAPVCDIKIDSISDVWLVVAAVIEILLRVASLVAIGFVIYGGATYIMSQGQPDKTKQALMTIINALVGLAITVVAAAVVSFVAGRF